MLIRSIRFPKTVTTLLFSLITSIAFGQWQLSSAQNIIGGNAEVDFPAINAAYLTSGQGQVYKSTDAGLSWNVILGFGPFSTVINPTFFNADTGYVSANNAVYRTFDGGANWTAISTPWGQPFGANISEVKLTGESLFASYVRNDTSYLVTSTDYGDSFSVIYSNYELNASGYLFSFTDSLTGHFINPRELE